MNFIDIAEILSKKPFVTPNTKSFQLHKWFQEHMHAFESQVQGVKAEEDFWEKINGLKLAGAEGIVVMPIEKIIT